MKKILYLCLILLSACSEDTSCKKDIERVFDSKAMAECVYYNIEERYSSRICYYSNLLYRINNLRNHSEKLIKANAEDILSEDPNALFDLYQVVGVCKLSAGQPYDVIDKMKYLLDEYKDGLFPQLFYVASLDDLEWAKSDTEFKSDVMVKGKKVSDFVSERKEKVKKRNSVRSYKEWFE